MSRQDSVLVVMFGLLLTGILSLRALINAPIIGQNNSYVFLQEHWLGMLIYGLPNWLIISIPVLLGMLSFVCVLVLLSRLSLSKMEKYLIILLFFISPIVSTTFVSYSELLFVTTLGLLAAISSRMFSAIPLIILATIHPLSGVILAIFFAGYYLHKYKLIASSLLIGPLIVGIILYEHSRIEWTGLFAEFASIQGYSLFLLLLGVVAVVDHWRKLNLAPIITWSVLFIISAYVVELRVLVSIALIIYVGKSLVNIFSQEWSLSFLRQTTIILLSCVALFVVITHTQALVQESPDADIERLLSLVETSSRQGSLLTSQELSSYASFSLTRDVYYFSSDDPFWELVRLTEVGPVLTQNDVRYLLFEKRFREKGFFFLLTTNDKFIRVSEQGNYELWVVLQEFVPAQEAS